MTWSVGIFETEAAAKSAAARLSRAGFRGRKVFYASRLAGQEEEAVQAFAAGAGLQSDQVKGYARVLQEGKSMVVVQAPSDRAQEAIEILKRTAMTTSETGGPAESGAPGGPAPSREPKKQYPRDDPAPFSRMIGMSPLRESAPINQVELSNDPAPFSKRLGQAVLRKSAPINEIKLVDDPAPLATRFGWKKLGKSGPTADIELSNDPAPLSTRMGIDVLLPPKRPWEMSLGFAMLMNNPAPLSSYLGLPTLSKKEDE